MGLLKQLRDKWPARRQESGAERAGPASPPVSGAPGEQAPSPLAPRNRAERRFWSHRIPKLARRIEMRHRGRMQSRRRVARWQVRLMRELGGHWAANRGRVTP